ncbi:hypothetical protein [Dongia sedimenti]|uniref:SMI1/KNR4 family protein n=1 Tax=Dongia sedimenti TaxID=3064282 RepID=A0ABU0YPY4_9PROT|nr:hypothetical protein [Rhodospirillaceae bacterium R-7]
MDLGPELFDLLNACRQKVGKPPARYGAPGLSAVDTASIEAELGFRLPPDFVYLFQNLQDPGGVFFPWRDFDKRQYDEMIAWVLHGIEFDIEHNGFWLERWGGRPSHLSAALEIARSDFPAWPKLLPIFGHRFLAAEPCRSGNPVFSIKQTDIIYYGADLAHYLLLEFARSGDGDYRLHTYAQEIRRIDVWSDLAR